MLIKRRRGWELSERAATPEAVFLDRRRFLAAAGLTLGAIALPALARAETDPSAGFYPARRNPAYRLDREITDEALSGQFNNFYEFGSHKRIARGAEAADPALDDRDRRAGGRAADRGH